MSGDLLNQIRAHHQRLVDLETQEALPVVARYTLASLTINNATITRVDYATQVFDPWAAVATGASWVFTAPVGGYYQVSTQLVLATSTGWALTEIAYLDLLKNAAQYAFLDFRNDINSGGSLINVTLHGSMLVYLAKADTLAARVYQASGGTLGVVGDAAYNYISIARIGR